MFLRVLCLLLLLPGTLIAQGSDRLLKATEALQEAEGARYRVRALTGVVQAFEDGLADVRASLRQARQEETILERELEAAAEELGQVLAVMQSISQTRMPTSLLHPDGALGSVRAGIMLQSIGPALQAQAAAVQARLQQQRDLKILQEDSIQRLEIGLADVRKARAALARAITDRTDRPRPYTEDPVRMALLIDASETLGAFSSNLLASTPDVVMQSFGDQKGTLKLPVKGVRLRAFNQEDAAGIARPGWVMATEAGAVVTTPLPATLRYLGPFPGFGQVVVLEVAPDTLLLLAGLGATHGTMGEILSPGDPVGFMPVSDENLTNQSLVTGTVRSETLYIELKQNQIALDPAEWFHS